MTTIATLILEDHGGEPDASEGSAYRDLTGDHDAGAGQVEGTLPLTLTRSQAAFWINSVLHDLIDPAHRARFRDDFDGLAAERGLTAEEMDLITNRKWIERIHFGVSFLMLEKMAAAIGVSNPEVNAAVRGEPLDEFLATRKMPMMYSVAGSDKAKAVDDA